MSKDQSTNVEFVTNLMEHSEFGALQQAFIIECIRYYSEKVTQNGKPKEDPNSFIDPALWYEIARYTKSTVEARYEK